MQTREAVVAVAIDAAAALVVGPDTLPGTDLAHTQTKEGLRKAVRGVERVGLHIVPLRSHYASIRDAAAGIGHSTGQSSLLENALEMEALRNQLQEAQRIHWKEALHNQLKE